MTRRTAGVRWIDEVAVPYKGDDCLTWPFCKEVNGRCRIKIDGRRPFVNRVVCEKAHGPAPSDLHHAAHSCGKGHLSCVNPRHIYWATPKQNQNDRYIHGTHCRGEKSGMVKLSVADVIAIRHMSDLSTRAVASKFGVTGAAISCIRNGKSWAWLEHN
jgi:hypothetical protein